MLTPLEWDSAFFGLRLARISAGQIDPVSAAQAVTLGRAQRLDCLSLLLPASDARSIAAAEGGGFRLVDTRMTLERPPGGGLPPRSAAIRVRQHQAADVPALEAIAGEAHQNTRFWRDPRFGAERAAELYRTWIRKECAGAADRVLVAEEGGSVAGYLSCHRGDGGLARIGLLGVRGDARGRGAGRTLLAAALAWFAEAGAPTVSVVTQGHGIAAQQLYQRAGFRTVSLELWFHCWLT